MVAEGKPLPRRISQTPRRGDLEPRHARRGVGSVPGRPHNANSVRGSPLLLNKGLKPVEINLDISIEIKVRSAFCSPLNQAENKVGYSLGKTVVLRIWIGEVVSR